MTGRAKIGVPEGGPYSVEGSDAKAPSTLRVAKANLPTRHGAFEVFVYVTPEYKDQVALTVGAVDTGPVLVRAHSECLTGDVLAGVRTR